MVSGILVDGIIPALDRCFVRRARAGRKGGDDFVFGTGTGKWFSW